MIPARGSISFYARTPVRGNRYLLTLPSQSFPLFTNNIASLFIPLLAALVPSAFVLLYMMARQLIRPIMRVTDIIDPSRAGSILENVASSLRSLEEQRSDLMYKIETQTAFMDIQSIMLLLQGGPQGAAPPHLQDFMRRNEADQYFVLMAELLEARDGAIVPYTADQIRKLADELPTMDEEKVHVVALETPGHCVALVCGQEQATMPPYARHFQRQLCAYGLPGTLVTLAHSAPFFSLMEAGRAYAQAKLVMDQKFIRGIGGILNDGADGAQEPERFMGYPVEQEMKILQALALGNAEDVERMTRHIVAEIRRERPAQAVAKSLCINLCNRALSLTGDACADASIHADFLALRESLAKPSATLDQFERRFLSLCQKTCGCTRPEKRSVNAELCTQINRYLEENFANPLLTLGMIAEHFGVSSGHLSRTFSERYNVSIMHRVDTLRMTYATALLRQSDQKLSDIIA
ncbi:MAG TPA: AraC family transcriptional regulator, partial [Clostridia bacterium]|nr:AraC family transcriptional regulator [Clostridia bacterium]